MKTAKDPDPVNLAGQYVRGADGRIFRVTMFGRSRTPWGRVNGADVEEIPRPFRECEAAEKDEGK